MTLQLVQQRLDALLTDKAPRVLLLTGSWGAGKTYQWKNAVDRAKSSATFPPYAYVSMFGVQGLAEVRKCIAEEILLRLRVPGSTQTLTDELKNDGWGWRPIKLLKLLPAIPYLSSLNDLANELSFSLAKEALICFDDLERAGDGLSMADLLGLASFLKEERACRVVLISNHEKLSVDGRDQLTRYLEKVVDEIVALAPTLTEAGTIALGDKPDTARKLLQARAADLGLSNIRVIRRLGDMAAALAKILSTVQLDPEILKQGVHSLALFGAAHFMPDDRYPPVSFLLNLENEWLRYFRAAKKDDEEQTEDDKKRAGWQEMLQKYGYGSTNAFDAEVGRAVQVGFFDSEALLPLAIELSDESKSRAVRYRYTEEWRKFWHSLDGDGVEMLRHLQQVTLSSLDDIGPGDVSLAYQVFEQAGQINVAEEILERFIEDNQRRPEVFDAADGVFRSELAPVVANRLAVESRRLRPPPSIEAALDRIDVGSGWNPEDVQIVGTADLAEIERLLRASDGQQFRKRIRALLALGTLAGAGEPEQQVSAKTRQLLRSLAAQDPIIGIRMRQYLPND